MLLGHVAGSALAARALKLDARVVILAGILPDVVDKSARHLFHLVPFGRIPSHTLLGLALTTLLVYLLGQFRRNGRALALAWGVGYASHLLFDFAGLLPLLWPFVDYQWPPTVTPFDWVLMPISWTGWLSIALELALVLLAVAIQLRHHVQRHQPSARTPRLAPPD